MVIGACLLFAGIVSAFSEVRDGSVSCGSVVSPVEHFKPEGETLAETLGYVYTGPGNDLSQKSDCTSALADQDGKVFSRVLPGGAMLVIAGLIAFTRDPINDHWGPLNKHAGKPGSEVVATSADSSLRPGWYPDQTDPTLTRWFDGTQWTSATLPRDPGGQTDTAQRAPDKDR